MNQKTVLHGKFQTGCWLQDFSGSISILLLHEELEGIFKKGKIREVVVFEDRFAERLEREGTAHMQIMADASDPNSAKMIVTYTQGIVATYLS